MSEITRWCAALLAVAFILATLFSGYSIAASQISGHATFSDIRGTSQEEVTRSLSPEKFQQAVTRSCMLAALFFVLSWVSVLFYRRLSS